MGGLRLTGGSVGDGAGDVVSSSFLPPGSDVASSKFSEKRSSAFGHVLEDIADLDSGKVAKAVEQEKKKRKTEKQARTLDDERSSNYNSLAADAMGEVSPEEYEAYKLTRMRSDDPMAKFV